MMHLPQDLKKYLDGSGNHLKVMATMADGATIHWAIFFGVKGSRPSGDNDFSGSINGDAGRKLKWNNERPLWLIPLTPVSREEALNAKKEGRLPVVPGGQIVLRNQAPATGTHNWKDYKFWYEEGTGQPEWDADAVLSLTPGTTLKDLRKGEWLDLKMPGDDNSWPVWLSTEPFQTIDRLIVFPAPHCHLRDQKGRYPTHEIWFGVRKVEHRPFVTINLVDRAADDGGDCPVIWRAERRINDLLAPKENAERFSLRDWKKHDIFKMAGAVSGGIINSIINDFKNIELESTNKKWFFQEKNRNGGQLKTVIYPVYIKQYQLLTNNEGQLFDLLGRDTTIMNRQYIWAIQIAREAISHLYVKIRYIDYNTINKNWNEKANAIKDGILLTAAASPVGIVPLVENLSQSRYHVIAEWRTSNIEGCTIDAPQFNLEESRCVKDEDDERKEVNVTITLPLLHDQHYSPLGKYPAIQLKKSQLDLTVSIPTVNDNGTLFQWVLNKYDLSSKGLVLRDGAMAFTLGDAAFESSVLPPNKYGRFRMVMQLQKSQRPFFLWQWYKGIDKEDIITITYTVEDFSLPVIKAAAAGHDISARDKLLAPRSVGVAGEGVGMRVEPPLIIPLNVETSGKYLLTMSESINVGQDHRLDMRLQEFYAEAGTDQLTRIKAVILDANPQFVGLVDAGFFQQPGYDDGAWVLARRSPVSESGGGWELLDDEAGTEGFRLILPAQAIGEAYVKHNKDEVADFPGEPQENIPVNFRFGAPAILRLAPGKLDRRYITAPWNIRRMWGQAGEAMPGVPLLEAQFELLYGLMGNLKPERAFIAELGAKLGEVPVPPTGSPAWIPSSEQLKAFKNAWDRYLRFYRAWQSRLAILEPYLNEGLKDAAFDKGLNFRPRILLEKTADTFKRKAGARLRYPLKPPDPTAPKDELRLKMDAAHDPEGLAGGFHYGFESYAIYRELWRESLSKGSSSAEMKKLAFSSAGGYGDQTARFANNKTTVRSITKMGRTHFYAVERIGRIGVFWHKAKHVIEYERTTAPSLQFKEQPLHLGRPLVRKVREYIEILEPVRNYPDFAGDNPSAPGAILACTYKNIIIPVLSSWGRDVWGDTENGKGLIGWEVPLWKRGADPAVYPKPQVILSLLPPPDADKKNVLLNLSEPENLWFYTDTREFAPGSNKERILITDDINAWPAILNVDFTDLPEPESYDIDPAAGENLHELDLPMPAVLDILPGYERFSFRVERNQTEVAVASRYYPDSEVSARMRTVSMMRSTYDHKKRAGWWGRGKSHLAMKAIMDGNNALLARAANGFRGLDTMVRKGAIPSVDRYRNEIKEYITGGGVYAALQDLQQADMNAQGLVHFAALSDKANGFTYPVRWIWRESLEAAEGLVNRTMAWYDNETTFFLKELERLLSIGGQQEAVLLECLKRYQERLEEFHTDVEFSADAASSAIVGITNAAIDKVPAIVAQTLDQLTALLDRLDPTKSVTDLRVDIRNELTKGFIVIRAQFESVLDKLDAIQYPLWHEVIEEVKIKLEQILTEAEAKFNSIIDAAAQDSIDYIRQAKREVYSVIVQINIEVQQRADAVRAAVNELMKKAREEFTRLNETVKDLGEEIAVEVERKIEEIADAWEDGSAIIIQKLSEDLKNTGKYIRDEILIKRISPILYKIDPPGQTDSIFDILAVLDGFVKELEKIVKSNLLQVFGNVDLEGKLTEWLKTIDAYQRLQEAINSADTERILRESIALADIVNREFGRLTGEVAQVVRDVDRTVNAGEEMVQTGRQTLNNFRSVWEQFTAPGMGLNRQTVAMLVRTDWKNVEQRLSITPCISRVKQFGKELEGLGLRVPVAAITDRLLSPLKDWENAGKSMLGKFDFSNLLSDIGGMRLDKLFPGFKMPEIARDKIKITKGIDKQKEMAWVVASFDVDLPGMKTLMSIGPIKVELENGKLGGRIKMDVNLEGKVNKVNSGELLGSWHLSIAGTPLMIFREAGIEYKNDKFTFRLDPEHMEMPGLLKMLTEATQHLTPGGGDSADAEEGETPSVFKIGLIKERGLPAGVKAMLDIPPISVGGGPSAITNLSFGGFFMLSALDKDLRFRFLIGLGFYFGKKDAPFNLTVFILGGGGYIDSSLYYEPEKGLTVDFVMSIHASVALEIALGWMRGGVAIMLGMEGEYHKTPDKGGSVYISIYVHVIGHVDILSIATIHLSILLQATYRALSDGSELVGTGQVKVTIRVCRFVKINVNKSYSKVFAGSGSSSSASGRLAPSLAATVPLDNYIAQQTDAILSSLA